MKLLIVVSFFTLLGLSAVLAQSLNTNDCPREMENFKCERDPFPECEDKVSGWTPCKCKTGFTCHQDSKKNCNYYCQPAKMDKPNTNDAEDSLFAGLVQEMKENGPESFELENAAPDA